MKVVDEKADTILRVKTAGFSVTERLSIDPGPAHCGDKTGLALWHDSEGAWVLSYEDFDLIAAAVAKARAVKRS